MGFTGHQRAHFIAAENEILIGQQAQPVIGGIGPDRIAAHVIDVHQIGQGAQLVQAFHGESQVDFTTWLYHPPVGDGRT